MSEPKWTPSATRRSGPRIAQLATRTTRAASASASSIGHLRAETQRVSSGQSSILKQEVQAAPPHGLRDTAVVLTAKPPVETVSPTPQHAQAPPEPAIVGQPPPAPDAREQDQVSVPADHFQAACMVEQLGDVVSSAPLPMPSLISVVLRISEPDTVPTDLAGAEHQRQSQQFVDSNPAVPNPVVSDVIATAPDAKVAPSDVDETAQSSDAAAEAHAKMPADLVIPTAIADLHTAISVEHNAAVELLVCSEAQPQPEGPTAVAPAVSVSADPPMHAAGAEFPPTAEAESEEISPAIAVGMTQSIRDDATGLGQLPTASPRPSEGDKAPQTASTGSGSSSDAEHAAALGLQVARPVQQAASGLCPTAQQLAGIGKAEWVKPKQLVLTRRMTGILMKRPSALAIDPCGAPARKDSALSPTRIFPTPTSGTYSPQPSPPASASFPADRLSRGSFGTSSQIPDPRSQIQQAASEHGDAVRQTLDDDDDGGDMPTESMRLAVMGAEGTGKRSIIAHLNVTKARGQLDAHTDSVETYCCSIASAGTLTVHKVKPGERAWVLAETMTTCIDATDVFVVVLDMSRRDTLDAARRLLENLARNFRLRSVHRHDPAHRAARSRPLLSSSSAATALMSRSSYATVTASSPSSPSPQIEFCDACEAQTMHKSASSHNLYAMAQPGCSGGAGALQLSAHGQSPLGLARSADSGSGSDRDPDMDVESDIDTARHTVRGRASHRHAHSRSLPDRETGRVVVLVGNKMDLVSQRQISNAQGMALASKHGAVYIECSTLSSKSFEPLVTLVFGTRSPKIGSAIVSALSESTPGTPPIGIPASPRSWSSGSKPWAKAQNLWRSDSQDSHGPPATTTLSKAQPAAKSPLNLLPSEPALLSPPTGSEAQETRGSPSPPLHPQAAMPAGRQIPVSLPIACPGVSGGTIAISVDADANADIKSETTHSVAGRDASACRELEIGPDALHEQEQDQEPERDSTRARRHTRNVRLFDPDTAADARNNTCHVPTACGDKTSCTIL